MKFFLKLLSKISFLKKLIKGRDLRLFASYKYIKGNGIEIGALHNPLKHSFFRANVKYIDRFPIAELRKQYPELKRSNLVKIDIVDDGEILHEIENDSLDFIIANHMLEHCKNPIKTIQNHITKIKKGGILYYTIPDMRYSFDKERELTTFEHLTDDYFNKNDNFPHYIEWCRYCDNITDQFEIDLQAKHLMQMEYSIHFHTWTTYSFFDFISKTNCFNVKTNLYEVIFFVKNKTEVIAILEKL